MRRQPFFSRLSKRFTAGLSPARRSSQWAGSLIVCSARALAACFVVLASSFATAKSSAADNAAFSTKVAPVLKQHCAGCHSGAKPKGDFDISALSPDFDEHSAAWNEVLDRITSGAMPPKGKPRLTDAEQRAATGWISSELEAYQARRTAAVGRTRLRRLNRIEYVNTIRDLLGAEIDIDLLPEDGIASGFDNVDAALDLSSTLLERYLEAADQALKSALARGKRPETTTTRYDMVPLAKQMTRQKKPAPRFGDSTAIRENEVVFYCDGHTKSLNEGKVPVAGLYRYRILARAVNRERMTLMIYAGAYGQGLQSLEVRVVAVEDVTDQDRVIEFTANLNARDTIKISPHGMVANINAAKLTSEYTGPGLAVKWIEVEGPIIDQWPPPQTTRLLGDLDLNAATGADLENVLRRFAQRAFRRPTTEAELAPLVALIHTRLERGYSAADALRVGLAGVLCSPDFVYLSASPGNLNDYDLATRLAYFLWSTMPDDELTRAAAQGDLHEPEVLRRQVERMLSDPKSHQFTENFTGQWLSLRNLRATNPDKKLYPDFDELLQWSMPQETHLFFEEILRDDRSVVEFIQSDWSMLNERLAKLYGIPDVTGSALRKVALPADSHRGGVMTQAAVLKVTANGTNTSPVVRGVWVLDHLLGTPPPPPPKDVPAIEPDIRGAKTIRQQLAKHRAIESCAACHAKIDCCGNALENFDVIGGWRTWYRLAPTSGVKTVKVETARGPASNPVGLGPNVDSADVLPDGRAFDGVDEFKRLLLANTEQIGRMLTEKLLVYATGHKLEYSDRDKVEAILHSIKTKNYGFRTLVHAIVQSPTFRSQ